MTIPPVRRACPHHVANELDWQPYLFAGTDVGLSRKSTMTALARRRPKIVTGAVSRTGVIATSSVGVIEIDDPNNVSDIDFLLACRDGDLDAFGELYSRHAPIVLRYAWSLTGSRATAEDILQETFATAWAKRKRTTIVEVSLLPWLLSICRNRPRNEVRRTQRRRTDTVEYTPDAASCLTDQFVLCGTRWIA